jgi:hypothetical protein
VSGQGSPRFDSSSAKDYRRGTCLESEVTPRKPAALVAEALGISIYAKQLVDGSDRRQLERLCRNITRPPLALERLSRRADGRLELARAQVNQSDPAVASLRKVT